MKLAPNLSLPPDSITRTFGILAVRGAGKSNTGAVMAEEMHAASLPFVVIDPVGSWWGLRSSSDGASSGLPIPIFGGEHGDIPLERGGGQLLAELIAEKRLSCVLDLSTFDSEAAKKSFLLAFAQTLYLKNRDPLHLFLEEADDYIPQKPMRDEAHLLRAWENIVRRGRSRGLGMTMITQRSAAINKMVLTQAETLIAMRTTSPQDQAVIEAWVKYHGQAGEIVKSLASLGDGEAWIWSPQFLKIMQRVQIRRRATFDNGATPRNVAASQKRKPATMADIDLATLRHRMAATIERAKADDPRELKAEVSRLKRELASRTPAAGASEQATKATIEATFKKGAESARREIRKVIGPFCDKVRRLAEQLQAAIPAQIEWDDFDAVVDSLSLPRAPARSMPIPSQPKRLAVSSNGNAWLPVGERAILIACAQYPSGCSGDQLSILTGYKRSSRDAYIQRLREKGYVTGQAATMVVAAEAGVAVLGSDYEPLPRGEELQEYWLARLPEGEKRILAELIAMYPKPMDRDRLDDATGYKRSSRDAYLQRLKSRRLVEILGRGEVRASKELFG